MSEEIKKLKEIKEKSLEGILAFLTVVPDPNTPSVNPMVYTNLYDFAEKQIASMSGKTNKSNLGNNPFKRDYEA